MATTRVQCPVFVAEDDDGSVVGFVSVGSRAHGTGETDAYVGELAVAERVQRRGVGSALMDAAESWSKEHGFRRLTLETGAANTVAREFYRSRGYLEEDVRLSVGLTELPVSPAR
ncbi:MAG: GNAT family N-acetyltransferase [Microlunatus sp.]|nr:GNAT family N-acetyltransferase [Microlunatus sp.]